MSTDLPHPPGPTPGQAPPEVFVRIEQTSAADARWHFSLALPNVYRSAPAGEGPSARDGTATLALYKRFAPDADIEVVGHWLGYEIDPADWLEAELAAAGRTVVSRRPSVLLSGVVGDVVAEWEHEHERFAGRFLATKWGPRLFVVCCRSRRADYAALADEMMHSVASFRALHHDLGALAELVQMVEQEQPFDWKVAVPESWELLLHPPTEEGAWFEAQHVAPAAEDEQLGVHDGRLSWAVMARSCAKRPRDAADVLLRALDSNEIQIESRDFVEEAARQPFKQAWYLATPIARHEIRGELRCRVMLHEHAWVVGGVLGPARADDEPAWMRNKRVLDLAAATLELTPL